MEELDDYVKLRILKYMHPIKHLKFIVTLQPHLFTAQWNYVWKTVPFIRDNYGAWYRILQRGGMREVLDFLHQYMCNYCGEFDFTKLRYLLDDPICESCLERHEAFPQTRIRKLQIQQKFQHMSSNFHRNYHNYKTEVWINNIMRKYILGYSICVPDMMRYGGEIDTLDDIFQAIKRGPP